MKEITFVIMGGTGDLTKRKLLPAIYGLIEENNLNKFSIVLCARNQINVKENDTKRLIDIYKVSIISIPFFLLAFAIAPLAPSPTPS